MKLSKKKTEQINSRISRGESDSKIASAERVSQRTVARVRERRNKAATPETTAKLKRDPLKKLRKQGDLDDCHLRAADLILAGHRLITDGLAVKCSSIECRVDGGRGEMTESEWSIRRQEQYKLWRRYCGVESVCPDVLLDVLTRPMTLRDVDRERRRRRGWSKDHLVAGLSLYCQYFL